MPILVPARRAWLLLSLLCACGSAPPSSPNEVGGDAGAAMNEADAAAPLMAPDARLESRAADRDGGLRLDVPTSSDPCAEVRCGPAPDNRCEGDTLKTYYEPNGTCVDGVCTYRFTTQVCPHGCESGRCLVTGGPTSGPDAAPASGDAPSSGAACGPMRCSTPPPNQCDGMTLKTYYDPNGSCLEGVCSYRFSTQTCPRGCQDGKCVTTSCAPGPAAFTADVTDVASLATVGPLPALAGGAGYEIRSYMQVKDSYAGMPVAIYAPTAMTLLSSVHYFDPMHDPSDTDYKGEWGLTFQASCTTQVTFAHVRDVVSKISEVTVGSPDAGSASGLVSRPVDFAAGEVIGHYLRGPGYFAWDFVVTDTNTTNSFVNMPRYQDGQLKFLHAICPYDFYPAGMRQRYLDLLGTNNDPPKAGRKCGTVAHDKVGTAAGVWFHAPYVQGTADEARQASGNPLSLFKAETDIVYVADLDGDTNKVGVLTFRIEPSNPTYQDPESITTSHCYERHVGTGSPATGWAFVKVLSDTEMQVAYGTEGACPAAFPTSGIRLYYR